MNVGDYVRTKNGINKIIYIDDIFGSDGKHSFYTIRLDNDNLIFDDEVIKSSPNIIDLIEVGDYVNKKYLDEDELKWYRKYPEYIKYVATKEQMEAMEYKVGE